MGDGVSIWLTLISEIFPKPHAFESVSEFDSSKKCKLFRGVFQVGLDVFSLTRGRILPIDPFFGQFLGFSLPLDQWRYQRLYFVVSALASAAWSATFPWCAIFAFGSPAHLDFRKRSGRTLINQYSVKHTNYVNSLPCGMHFSCQNH
jgi:hypothetical protein